MLRPAMLKPGVHAFFKGNSPYSISQVKIEVLTLFAAVISRKKPGFSAHWARLSACAANRAFA